MKSLNIKTEIVEHLKKLGFDLIGVASTTDLSFKDAIQKYKKWLTEKNQASMNYLDRHLEKKENPHLLLEDCKSIVCVGLSYSQKPIDHTLTDKPLISLYTKGEDYHLVLKNKLEEACKFFNSKYNFKYKIFTDIEPVLERFWAARSGLGWIGKNSMLIHRKVGSFFFIGGFLTTLELEADNPDTDHCGKCTKCIDACPTNAILSNRTINSNDCIAYHTIENKNAVLEEKDSKSLALNFGTWIAGCDICQNVCPWNDPPFPFPPFFKNQNPVYSLNFEEMLQLNETDFKKNLSPFAMERMKFAGFLKNITIALTNSNLQQKQKDKLLQRISSLQEDLPSSPRKEALKQQLNWARKVKK